MMVISFRMLYHYTWNSKTNLDIVSSLDLNIISNKNDNHKHKLAHDLIICIWILFTMYGSSILFLSGVWGGGGYIKSSIFLICIGLMTQP